VFSLLLKVVINGWEALFSVPFLIMLHFFHHVGVLDVLSAFFISNNAHFKIYLLLVPNLLLFAFVVSYFSKFP
jgi:hypothetical protein